MEKGRNPRHVSPPVNYEALPVICRDAGETKTTLHLQYHLRSRLRQTVLSCPCAFIFSIMECTFS